MRLVTSGDAQWLDYEADIFYFTFSLLFRELQHDCTRSARFVPNISGRSSFTQNKSRHLRRFRRLEDFCIVMRGDLFRRHRSVEICFASSVTGLAFLCASVSLWLIDFLAKPTTEAQRKASLM